VTPGTHASCQNETDDPSCISQKIEIVKYGLMDRSWFQKKDPFFFQSMGPLVYVGFLYRSVSRVPHFGCKLATTSITELHYVR
jgi:hypothetical protein